MKLFGRLKTKKALGALRGGATTAVSQRTQVMTELEQLGRTAIPELIEALSDDELCDAVVPVLMTLLDDRSLPAYVEGLQHPQRRVVERVASVLTSNHHYDANQLLPLFTEMKVSKRLLTEILLAHKHTLQPKAVLGLLAAVSKDNRTVIFHFLAEVATSAMLPDLLPRTWSEDWFVRMHMARILGKISTAAVHEPLLRLAQDHDKNVRIAALEGLTTLSPPFASGPLCGLLRDPDLSVQSKVIEVIVQSRDPHVLRPLLELLQDESEYVRRAVVEIFNALSYTDAIKELLAALRDQDWWVRVRAADALGHMGGPKVVDAVLPLVKDQDEFIRRCAIEILNTTKDPRAFQYLLEALEDADWWVQERAIDALVQLGRTEAVPALLRLVTTDTSVTPAAIRAVVTLGDPQLVEMLLPKLHSPSKAVCQEAVQALETVTDASHAAVVQRDLVALQKHHDVDIRYLVQQVLQALITKFGDKRPLPSATSVSQITRSGHSGVRTTLSSRRLPAGETTSDSATVITRPSEAFGGPLLDVKTLPPGSILAERYRLIRQIGEGGFGVVVLVHDLAIGEEIVLKFLRPSLSTEEEVIKRFVHELRYTRKLAHENIIRIYDFITIENAWAISMEYFPSHSLDVELQAQRPIARARGLHIVEQICRGLHVAHQAGIVHRDLKPQNILLSTAGQVKIVDFGLALALLSPSVRLTANDAMLGTPTYMAPEQILPEKKVDTRTDIYSLGVMMYEMFTGKQPYRGRHPMEILVQHTKGNAIAPRQIRPDLPPTLEHVILKAMAVSARKRFQSVVELQESLAACQA